MTVKAALCITKRTWPAVGDSALTCSPATSEAQLLNVNTLGSKVNTNGAMVTMLGPFLVSEMGTSPDVPRAPLAEPMLICGPLGAVTVTAPALPGGGEIGLAASAMPAAMNVKVDAPADAPPLIVKVQCAISPSEMTVKAALCITSRGSRPLATPR